MFVFLQQSFVVFVITTTTTTILLLLLLLLLLLQRVIDAALIPRPSNEVIAEGFGLSINRRDMHTLADLNWLNDEVSQQFL